MAADLLCTHVRQALESSSDCREDVFLKLKTADLLEHLVPSFSLQSSLKWIARGTGSSSGCASGKIYFTADSALKAASLGEDVILVQEFTRAVDLEALKAVKGIVTLQGGFSSHASIVARAFGKPCIVGASKFFLNEGHEISIDGYKGDIWVGKNQVVPASRPYELNVLLEWADEIRGKKIGVYANADTSLEIETALNEGADGIGVCRTEHMFLSRDGARLIQKLVRKDKSVLEHLLEVQRRDFKGLFKAACGKPITIRLLDAPLHEFGADFKEENPMMGLRGIRLAVIMPEIYKVQMQAILQAASAHCLEGGLVSLEVMVPLISVKGEWELACTWWEEMRALYQTAEFSVKFGTMIETPRAAMIADDLAKTAQFFSFGTNDLSQMTFGYSRDDVYANWIDGNMMEGYLNASVIHADPFIQIDPEGVGRFIQMAASAGRLINPYLKMGICGEQAAQEDTFKFALEHSMDYISCSSNLLPLARFHAASAILKTKRKDKGHEMHAAH